ncbi:MAG: PhzF family phenazine biosynthesis protein [Balneolaceae bacterium]|nr:PhzF family phenazine biosynthesis protein [Balneolaceae bacterium]
MILNLYQVDAFASKVFEGNPAAVCLLQEWLSDKILQQIALENNLSETAFFLEQENGFRLRWFTPEAEVDLCGHATLATAHVLFSHLNYEKDEILFHSNSGTLTVRQDGDLLKMNFPASFAKKVEPPKKLIEALGVEPEMVFRDVDYMVILNNEQQVKKVDPNYFMLNDVKTRGVIVTAPGKEVDFVSRFFAPAVGVNEDPVTGSAHTMLAPYWSERLGKKDLTARQISKRGGNVFCTLKGERVEISGKAKTYLVGQIEI